MGALHIMDNDLDCRKHAAWPSFGKHFTMTVSLYFETIIHEHHEDHTPTSSMTELRMLLLHSSEYDKSIVQLQLVAKNALTPRKNAEANSFAYVQGIRQRMLGSPQRNQG